MYVLQSRNNDHGELILKMIYESILYELIYQHRRDQLVIIGKNNNFRKNCKLVELHSLIKLFCR